jgi:hypothetical protein
MGILPPDFCAACRRCEFSPLIGNVSAPQQKGPANCRAFAS